MFGFGLNLANKRWKSETGEGGKTAKTLGKKIDEKRDT